MRRKDGEREKKAEKFYFVYVSNATDSSDNILATPTPITHPELELDTCQ